jgi:acyl-CoA thioesterase
MSSPDERRAFDDELIPLDWHPTDPLRFGADLSTNLVRPDGALFGGGALAATLLAFERITGRPALYASVQFVATAAFGDRLECRVDRVAAGHTVDQLQLVATSGDQLVFSAIGGTATRKPAGISGLGLRPPAVLPPEDCPSWGPAAAHAEIGHHRISDYRETPIVDPDPARPGHMAMWVRVLDSPVTTSAKLGYIADMVPIAVCRAAGELGAGTSMDNTIRLGEARDTEWVLIEMEGQLAAGGFGHGSTHLWTPDGHLLATGSQSAKLFAFSELMARRLAEGERPGPG